MDIYIAAKICLKQFPENGYLYSVKGKEKLGKRKRKGERGKRKGKEKGGKENN
jgi:hypothetical protein